MIKILDRVLGTLEDAMMFCACLAILAIVCITAADVGFRYGLNAPFAWSHDVITQYLLVATFFLSLPYVTRIRGHMSLDYMARLVRNPLRRNAMSALGDILSIALVLGFAYASWDIAVEAYQGGDTLPGDLALPTWPSRMLGPVSAIVLAFRLTVMLLQTLEASSRRTISPHLEHDAH